MCLINVFTVNDEYFVLIRMEKNRLCFKFICQFNEIKQLYLTLFQVRAGFLKNLIILTDLLGNY